MFATRHYETQIGPCRELGLRARRYLLRCSGRIPACETLPHPPAIVPQPEPARMVAGGDPSHDRTARVTALRNVYLGGQHFRDGDGVAARPAADWPGQQPVRSEVAVLRGHPAASPRCNSSQTAANAEGSGKAGYARCWRIQRTRSRPAAPAAANARTVSGQVYGSPGHLGSCSVATLLSFAEATSRILVPDTPSVAKPRSHPNSRFCPEVRLRSYMLIPLIR